MNEKQEKKFSVGFVVCFIAMIAFVGVLTFGGKEKEMEEQPIAQAEQTSNSEEIQAKIEDIVPMETPKQVIVTAPSEPISKMVLDWPIEGNVMLHYSMDQTIYFPTLDQYKYNPAIIISGNVGDEVRAAETGKVISIKEEAKTGTTIRMDLGHGFEMVCGQLSAVRVKEGQLVNKGELLGYVAEPSKYYVVEGPNVYFQLLKDGNPVNPLDYMDS